MRYLGIDYGRKRIGIALSDMEGRLAFPKDTLLGKSSRAVARSIKELVKREKVEKIVIGLPIGFGGRDTEETLEVRKFAEILKENINIPAEFENELLTTKIAEATTSKERADASAAALILQSYLDKKGTANRAG